MSRSILFLLLLCASASVAARDASMDGPNGDGGHCSDTSAVESNVADSDTPPPSKPVRATHTVAKPSKPVKPVPTVRSGDGDSGTRIQAPRWHSFLPGMFR